MGHFRPTENAIAQFAPDMTKAQNPGQEGGTGHIHCAPVVFADPEIGTSVFGAASRRSIP
jgi:hypothetical protein